MTRTAAAGLTTTTTDETHVYTKLLVPLDGSSYSERALPVALALARRSVAEIDLVHVHDLPMVPGPAPRYDTRFDAELREAMRAELEAVVERLRQETDVPLRTTFLDGPVAPTLAAYAANHLPALIVMTTHGRGGLSRLWLGSVADALVRNAGVPVLLVRGEGEPPTDVAAPVFRHVLVPLDGSERAEAVLEHAVRLGTSRAATYTLLTVVAPRLMFARSYPGMRTPPVDQDDLEPRLAEAQAYLDHVAGELRRSGATVATRVVVNLQTAQGILEAAATEGADLIALATRGRGAVPRLVLGSVADKVVRGAETPVLVIRPMDLEPELAPPGPDEQGDG